MIYCATVKSEGTDAGTWTVSPAYTRVDGQQAPDIIALAVNGIVPEIGDIVLCAEGINPFDHSSVKSFDNNGGANPLIIGTFEQLLTTLCNVVIKGDLTVEGGATLGLGTFKMVLGESLATWAQSVDLALSTLSSAAGNYVPTIVPSVWLSANLSNNHKLD